MEQTRRMRIIVSGRVQGVFFRAATQQKAQALDLTGWVRNLSGGDVEILAEGRPSDLQALRQWCGQGPPRARVDHVVCSEEPAQGGLQGFEVRRDG